MKKAINLTVMAVLAAMCLTLSCTKETPRGSEEGMMPEISFTAYIGGESTRTVLLNDNLKPFWSPYDEFTVFSGGNSARFVSDNTEPAKDATFSGNLTAGSPVAGYTYWALYPYRQGDKFADDVFSTTLPPTQEALTGSFSDDLSIMVAKSNEERSFDFYNVCSGLRFRVDKEGISRVTLIANGLDAPAIAGSFSIDYTGSSPLIADIRESFKSVTVSCAPGNTFELGEWYYIMVLPSTLSRGFTVLLEGDGGIKGLFFYEKSISFNQSKFRQLTMTARSGSSGNTWYFSPESCCIVNVDEKNFIAAAETTYVDDELDINSSNFYKNSIVTSYSSSKNQYPLPVEFTTGSGKTLVYSTDPTFETSISTNVSASPCEIYNLIPGVEYYYKVLASDGSVIKVGSITPTGPLRAMKLSGVKNLRDLGGWESSFLREDGSKKTIKYGKIYRGTELGGNGGGGSFSSNDKAAFLSTTGVTVDLDLRGYGSGNPSNPLGFEQTSSLPHYKNLQVCQFMVEGSSFDVTADLYRQALRFIISHLSNNDEVVYFHCIGGADRTGTLAFMIESLLGVSETDMNIDYELTSFNSTRLRTNEDTSSKGRPFKVFVKKMKQTYAPTEYPNDIHTAVYKWATTGDNALTDAEINQLRELMLE